MSSRNRKRGAHRRKSAAAERRGNPATNGARGNGQHNNGPVDAPRGSEVGFWGDAGALPNDRPPLHISDEPEAVVRSLGTPPLPGHERVAAHYFAAVYDRAVTLAGALAAAGGMLTQQQLEEELEDGDG